MSNIYSTGKKSPGHHPTSGQAIANLATALLVKLLLTSPLSYV